MKKLILIIIALLTIAGCAMAQNLTVQGVEAKAGEQATLTVSVAGATAMTALQFNLDLPEGVNLSESNATMGAATDGHTLSVQTLDNGDRMFVIYSMDLNTFKDGELLRIPVTLGSDAKTGEGKVYTVRMATTESVSHKYAETTFTITVKNDEQPVTITADDKTMTYGDNVPTLTYKSSGAALKGTPKLSTTAKKTSPVGTYSIKVEKGTVTNEQVTYVDGKLTIEKAPLTVGAQDVTITEGDDIPAFTLTYSGWRNNDTEANAFTKKPTATTTATKTSAPGSYPITVSDGEAKNYSLTYTGATLTIEAKSVELPDVSGMMKIHDLDFAQNEDYYITLDMNDQRGTAWETGNAKQQKIFNVSTPEEMRNVLALQSTYSGESGTKGWWARCTKGGLWCYGASRSAAVLNLSKGDIVVFESSADVANAITLTNGSGDPDGPFTFVKTSDGREYYCTMTDDGQLGFCGVKNNGYITSIKVYSNNTSGIEEVKATKFHDGGIYDLFGRKLTSPKKGINIIGGKKVIQ